MFNQSDLFNNHPNQAFFLRLAIEHSETQYQLEQLTAHYAAEKANFQRKLEELEELNARLHIFTNRASTSEAEEAERQKTIDTLRAAINAFGMPEPVNEELYQMQRLMLTHRQKEAAHTTTSLLVGQAQKNKN